MPFIIHLAFGQVQEKINDKKFLPMPNLLSMKKKISPCSAEKAAS